jgi:hypothetical protein
LQKKKSSVPYLSVPSVPAARAGITELISAAFTIHFEVYLDRGRKERKSEGAKKKKKKKPKKKKKKKVLSVSD